MATPSLSVLRPALAPAILAWHVHSAPRRIPPAPSLLRWVSVPWTKAAHADTAALEAVQVGITCIGKVRKSKNALRMPQETKGAL